MSTFIQYDVLFKGTRNWGEFFCFHIDQLHRIHSRSPASFFYIVIRSVEIFSFNRVSAIFYSGEIISETTNFLCCTVSLKVCNLQTGNLLRSLVSQSFATSVSSSNIFFYNKKYTRNSSHCSYLARSNIQSNWKYWLSKAIWFYCPPHFRRVIDFEEDRKVYNFGKKIDKSISLPCPIYFMYVTS
jgi:hypothetical protein